MDHVWKLLVAIAALAVLTAAGAWALLGTNSSSATAQQELTQHVQSCIEQAALPGRLSEEQINSQAVRSVATNCVSAKIEEITLTYGPDAAWDAMLTLQRSTPEFGDCHEAAHAIAHGAAQLVPHDTLTRYSRPECSYGYLDGAIMAIDEANPNVDTETLLTLIDATCQNIPNDSPDRDGISNNCYHGAGHALWERHQPDVDATLRWCSELSSEPAYPGAVPPMSQCVGGASMSFAGETLNPDNSLTPKYPTPGKYCAQLDTTSAEQCLMYAIQVELQLRNNNADSYLTWCTDPANGIETVTCFTVLAGHAGFFHNAARYLAACLDHAQDNTEHQDARGQGFLRGIAATSDLTLEQAARQICDTLPKHCATITAAQERLPISGMP